MAITGAILDFDGTLIDSLDGWRNLEDALAKEAQIVVTPEDRAQLTTFTLDETASWFHDRFGLGKDAATVRAMMDDYMVDFLTHQARILPGVVTFLEECKQRGVVLSVASSSPQLYLQTALREKDLLPYFSAVLSVEDVGHSKREPHIFDHARKLMATPKPSTWGFDDSRYALAVLKQAGYPTVGIFDPHEGASIEQWQEESDIVVKDFEDLSFDWFDAETKSA